MHAYFYVLDRARLRRYGRLLSWPIDRRLPPHLVEPPAADLTVHRECLIHHAAELDHIVALADLVA